MKCGKPSGVTQILIGLHRVGLIGLLEAFKGLDPALKDPEEIADRLIASLREDNYIPDSHIEAYRRAIYRELLRYRGEDMRDYFSEIEVTVRAEPGEARDEFVEMLVSVLDEFELKPVVTYSDPSGEGGRPELLIGDEPVIGGKVSRQALKSAIGRRISEW